MNDSAAPLDPGSRSGGSGPTTIQAQVRTGQIISFALIQGIILVTAVMTYLAFGSAPGDAQAEGEVADELAGADGGFALPLIGAAVTVAAGIAAVVLPRVMRQTAMERFRASGHSLPLPVAPEAELPPAATQLLGSWSAATLIGQALLEGPAILNAILMMIDPHVGYLALIAVMLAGIAMLTPTVDKVQRFLEAAARR